MTKQALIGADLFDGRDLKPGSALLLQDDIFKGIVATENIPTEYEVTTFDGGTLLPGFVDLQVNGGGGVMFNDETTVEGLEVIAKAHSKTGTRALLPTLITDSADRSRVAVDAVEQAIKQGISGIVGIHLEGPHLSIARKGAHDPNLIRPMDDTDEAFLLEAIERLPNVMVTVAPENVRNDQIQRLSNAGAIISLGHTDCTFAQAQAAFEAGARCATHLFNAMSQLGNREPGLVGAALNNHAVSAGLIADDIHVHATSMRTALSAKQGPGRIFLVTDAMSTVGSDITEFQLNGRTVLRRYGRLTLEDGTLAGADLDFSTAISVLVDRVGISKAKAIAMATSWPADILKNSFGFGRFIIGKPARAILLNSGGKYVKSA